MDTTERIFSLVDEMFQEQRLFAATINVTPSIVSEWRNRKSFSYVKRLEKISDVLDTSPEYLLTGKGARHRGDAIVSDSSAIGIPGGLTQSEYELLLAYRRADARAQSMVGLALEPFKKSSQSEKAI